MIQTSNSILWEPYFLMELPGLTIETPSFLGLRWGIEFAVSGRTGWILVGWFL